MTRPKKGPGPAETIADRKAREAQRKAPESVSLPFRFMPPPSGSPQTVPNPPLPPKMPYEETKRILKDKANKRRWVEAALVPLPADEEDDSYSPHPGFKHIRELPSDVYDPVVRKWNMYMNVRPNQHIMLLRYPEKMPGQLYKARNGQKPLEMRIKTKSRLVEIDIPLDPHHPSYDKVRGIIYGEALRKSKILKEKGGAYGLAGGFGLGGPTQTRAAARAAQSAVDTDHTVEALLEDYDNAVKNGHVMNKMTLGGHIIQWQEGYANLFAGAFTRGKSSLCVIACDCSFCWKQTRLTKVDDVFFTKVDAQVFLRPQLIHLDALNDQNKSTIRMQAGADTEENEAQHLNMTIKNTEGETMESAGEAGEIAKTLKAMRAEPWQRLTWVDSEVRIRCFFLWIVLQLTEPRLKHRSTNFTRPSSLPRKTCPSWSAICQTNSGWIQSAVHVSTPSILRSAI